MLENASGIGGQGVGIGYRLDVVGRDGDVGWRMPSVVQLLHGLSQVVEFFCRTAHLSMGAVGENGWSTLLGVVRVHLKGRQGGVVYQD